MCNFIIITPKPIDVDPIRSKYPNSRWIHYYNCEEALGAITVFQNRIHAVFVAYSMSFLNGVEVQQLIKKQFHELPVIIMHSLSKIHDFLSDSSSHHYLASYPDFLKLKEKLEGSLP